MGFGNLGVDDVQVTDTQKSLQIHKDNTLQQHWIDTDEKTLRYPSDMRVDANTDYIQFDFFKYRAPFYRGGSGLNKQGAGKRSGYDMKKEGFDIAGNFGDKVPLPTIMMYMPQDLSTSYAAEWGGKEFGSAATFIFKTMTSRGAVAGPLFEVGKGLPAGTIGATSQLIASTMQAAGQQITQNDVLAGTTDSIKNPNVEVLFGGPKLRNIGFKWKMTGKSRKECMTINRICKIFKMESMAAYGNAEGDGVTQDRALNNMKAYNNFIQIPDLVRMRVMNGKKLHPYLTQYKSLAITNVDINYTPDGSYTTYLDGFPTTVELAVKFVETKLVYKENLQQGEEWSY